MRRPKDLFGKPLPPTPEELIHAAIVEYLRINGHPKLLFFHCPTGFLERPSQRIRAKKLGVLAGVADLVLILPGGICAFAEVKGPFGLLTTAQKEFQARCAVLGLRYRILKSVDDAKEVFTEWGALR